MVKSRTTDVPASRCCACGYEFEAATSVDERPNRPTPGAISICWRCGHIMLFKDDLTTRDLTEDEMIEVVDHPEILKIQLARELFSKEGERMLNQAIAAIPMPDRIKRLPVSPTGFPVPWFVAWLDGEPDFRVVGPGKLVAAVNRKLCWVCGEPLGQYKAFPIGPMCAINRTIAEPPSHLECAEYSVRACPFLSNPRTRRNEKDLPEGHQEPADTMIRRNPGAICIWVTKQFRVIKSGNGILFRLGDPVSVHWYAEGRKATRAEVQHSIDTGLPLLMAEAEKGGPEDIEFLKQCIARVEPLLPPLNRKGEP